MRLAREGRHGLIFGRTRSFCGYVVLAVGRGPRGSKKVLARRKSLRSINVGRLRRRTAVIRSDDSVAPWAFQE